MLCGSVEPVETGLGCYTYIKHHCKFGIRFGILMMGYAWKAGLFFKKNLFNVILVLDKVKRP